jgi:excinuclease UvrABC nuclease subunit
MDKPELEKMIARLEQEMRQAARDLAFERAAEVRDMIIELRKEIINKKVMSKKVMSNESKRITTQPSRLKMKSSIHRK